VSGWTNPTNPNVIAGSATFNNNGNVLEVTVLTTYAVIQWDDFSIQNFETTQFLQLSQDSLVINQVATSMTTIDGLLTGNGMIWILNPASFLVGQDGTVEAASFLASTMILNVVGDHWYDSPGVAPFSSFFINQGTVRTTVGDLIFLCNNLSNEGTVEVAIGGSRFIVMTQKSAEGMKDLCFFWDHKDRSKWQATG
jgi:filamentous hemagglutinin family protein